MLGLDMAVVAGKLAGMGVMLRTAAAAQVGSTQDLVRVDSYFVDKVKVRGGNRA